MNLAEKKRIRKRSLTLLRKAGIVVTKEEANAMEVADFGLDDIKRIGLQLVVYENNDRYCAKELIMLPRQTCPEHRHPPNGDQEPGKVETFRCRWGRVFLYTVGEPTKNPAAVLPRKYRPHFTVKKEILLEPGDQYTIPSDTLHWFQAGKKGCVVSEFSSSSHDESDVFTDPHVQRIPEEK
ncbi:MAG: D-lyxose/D-mannose family sugar isomerase [Bacteroidota bacterium]